MMFARFRRHTKRAAKSLHSKRLISQLCEVGFHLEALSFQRAAYIGQLQEEIHHTVQKGLAVTSSFQLQIAHRLKHWIVDFLSFEMIACINWTLESAPKVADTTIIKNMLHGRFLFAASPCIPDLLMAKDFKASVLHVSELPISLPKIPYNSPQSRIALSKKQDVVVRSSIEVEYRAMVVATCELIWLKHLLRELRFGKNELMKLIYDSQVALHIASNPVFHEMTKHIEVDCHFIREKIASGCVATSFVNSNDQLADISTKSLKGPRIKYICNKLGAYNIYASA
ncbi:Retrovirus-related Pol polyprotein from transposon RE1 [Vitis vinifera]|uniref:Retrovirus-related Pol polyprotein from transposon RE1 n=1 Tax=Vitis vinifera TaxID=29760 RepID=A0A438CPD7_VITVI|nr:Retrovirus-related Pol polyprotein from transposon RE1 [Vitis vinifera]